MSARVYTSSTYARACTYIEWSAERAPYSWACLIAGICGINTSLASMHSRIMSMRVVPLQKILVVIETCRHIATASAEILRYEVLAQLFPSARAFSFGARWPLPSVVPFFFFYFYNPYNFYESYEPPLPASGSGEEVFFF
uniref:Uncharacterized protein n=1 Tax=Trichogramma kaykai TaxID=54128 RepID=A0ABD2X945_9HYME